MSQNKTSYTNGTVQLGGEATFEQMKHVESIFRTASLEALTSGETAEALKIAELAKILGVDVATIEDADAELHQVA